MFQSIKGYDSALITCEEQFEGWKQPKAKPATWTNRNDDRDTVDDADEFLSTGDPYDKARLLDQYMERNNEPQLLIDLNGDKLSSSFFEFYIGSTPIHLFQVSQGYEDSEWRTFQEVFGSAMIWDELAKQCEVETLMDRLGYKWTAE